MYPLLLTALLTLSPARATTYAEEFDLDDLSTRAERVVLGDVLTIRYESDRAGFWTVAAIRVTETLRGRPEPVVEVRVPGGRIDDMELTVAGAPRLIEGYEVLLFLDGDHVVGLGQRAFVVMSDAAWRNASDDVFTNPRMEQELTEKDVGDKYTTYSLADVRRAVR